MFDVQVYHGKHRFSLLVETGQNGKVQGLVQEGLFFKATRAVCVPVDRSIPGLELGEDVAVHLVLPPLGGTVSLIRIFTGVFGWIGMAGRL